jgi:hypothetical protein
MMSYNEGFEKSKGILEEGASAVGWVSVWGNRLVVMKNGESSDGRQKENKNTKNCGGLERYGRRRRRKIRRRNNGTRRVEEYTKGREERCSGNMMLS